MDGMNNSQLNAYLEAIARLILAPVTDKDAAEQAARIVRESKTK